MADFKKIFDNTQNIDIERLMRLCRISLSDEKREKYAQELKKMADYTYPRLKCEDASLPFSYCSAEHCMREDIPSSPSAADCELIMSLAPHTSDGYISVPKVIKEGGDE